MLCVCGFLLLFCHISGCFACGLETGARVYSPGTLWHNRPSWVSLCVCVFRKERERESCIDTCLYPLFINHVSLLAAASIYMYEEEEIDSHSTVDGLHVKISS